MFKIQCFLKIKKSLIEISSLEPQPLPATLPAADQVIITISDSLLEMIQFHFIKDQHIELPEQIKWQINSLLEKSIENYYFDYQLFNNKNDQEIRGLCCSIEKQKIEPVIKAIQTINKNICSIGSSDKQFTLYKQAIPLWEQTSLMQGFTKVAIISAILVILLGIPIAVIQNQLNKKIQQSISSQEKTATELAQKYTQLITLKQLQNQTASAERKHKQLYQSLQEITVKTPTQFFFQEVTYLKENGSLEILGFTDSGLSAIEKYTKTLKQIATIQTATITKTTHNNKVTSFEITTLLDGNKKKIKNKLS